MQINLRMRKIFTSHLNFYCRSIKLRVPADNKMWRLSPNARRLGEESNHREERRGRAHSAHQWSGNRKSFHARSQYVPKIARTSHARSLFAYNEIEKTARSISLDFSFIKHSHKYESHKSAWISIDNVDVVVFAFADGKDMYAGRAKNENLKWEIKTAKTINCDEFYCRQMRALQSPSADTKAEEAQTTAWKDEKGDRRGE